MASAHRSASDAVPSAPNQPAISGHKRTRNALQEQSERKLLATLAVSLLAEASTESPADGLAATLPAPLLSAGHSLIFDHMKSEHRARASAFMTEASLMHDAEFEQSFRVSRVLFRRIADAISSDETVSKSKFPVDLQLSVLLQSYAHGMSVGACSTLFGISKQTVCNIRRNVNHAILTQLGDQLSWYASKNVFGLRQHSPLFRLMNQPLRPVRQRTLPISNNRTYYSQDSIVCLAALSFLGEIP
jgi:hypothetical protein